MSCQGEFIQIYKTKYLGRSFDSLIPGGIKVLIRIRGAISNLLSNSRLVERKKAS